MKSGGEASDLAGRPPAGPAKHPGGPSFLVIGAPRSGTTWLKKALRAHSGVRLPPGEPEYFAKGLEAELDRYLALFPREQEPAAGPPIVFGDKSPASLKMTDERIARCAALYPELRLICLVREPVSRAWSHLMMVTRGEPAASDLKRGAFQPLLQDAIDYGRYRRHLRRWAAHFPAEQFLLVDFEQILDAPEAVFSDVLRHIGARPEPLRHASVRSWTAAPPREIALVLEAELDGEMHRAAGLRGVVEEAAELAFAARARAVASGLDPADAEIAAWRRRLAGQPDSLDARQRLAELLMDRAPAEAADILHGLARDQPGGTSTWRQLAAAWNAAGEAEAELDALRRVGALGALDPQEQGRLARLLSAGGRHEEAARSLRALAEETPGSLEAWRRLADALRRAEDAEGELIAVERALGLDPGDGKVRGRVAVLLLKLGRVDEAQAQLELLRAARRGDDRAQA